MNQENEGKHNVLMFRQQTDPTTTADQVSLYIKSIGGVPNLFFRPRNSGTPIQLTYSSISTGLQSTNPDVYLPQQYSFVAGPFIVYAGSLTSPTKGQVVNLTPSSTLIYVDLTMADSDPIPTINPTIIPTSIAANSFTIEFQTGLNPKKAYYLAIGKP